MYKIQLLVGPIVFMPSLLQLLAHSSFIRIAPGGRSLKFKIQILLMQKGQVATQCKHKDSIKALKQLKH